MPQRTKIIATLGPASDSLYALERMLNAGMDIARLNFSHGSYEHFSQIIKNLRQAAKKTGKNVAILQDLQGPKIRVGKLPEEGFPITKNQQVVLTTSLLHKKNEVPIQYKKLPLEVKKNDTILIDDGLIELKVVSTTINSITTKSLTNGVIKSHKGINTPNATLSAASLTKKDLADLKFGIKNGVDYVALSFVKSARDIINLRKHTDSKIIAKIERKEAIENMREIIEAADGVMVARGDLGLEIPAEQVPIYQKEIIHLCNEYAKPVIVATQMLESMIENSRPTRAEISDAATAIFDRADAFMLSNETATGQHPLESIQTLAAVARAVENELKKKPFLLPALNESKNLTVTEATCLNAINLAQNIKANHLVLITEKGYTARQIAKYRPMTELIAITTSEQTGREMALIWGINKIIISTQSIKNESELETATIRLLKKNRLVKSGNKIVIVSANNERKLLSTVKI
ncbi:MAG: hypothetical protein ACD_51C00335G0002 [uncultured bacterium]|nr:MAG: hypothetical protein ACD_51C00335G0002 [uncultured bacterium]OGJ47369.1 MAG: pyruvate kinase [Candidatus Peregrinibacteria bacterium RIFOXYA2_FULL_41_18]OGJ47754.1 MAG: pyruvate kinase [Candidatus Peregrinibacteria bacterium RIFOXYB12_FULL_41_12]